MQSVITSEDLIKGVYLDIQTLMFINVVIIF